jgi:FkbM family methyltransferase
MHHVLTRMHLHRLAPAWRRSRRLAGSPAGLVAIWRTLALGLLERYVPGLRSDRLRAITIVGPHGQRRLHLRANAWDTFTFYEVFLKEIYSAALPLPRGATVFDLGANIGLASVYLSMHSPGSRLVAVEPDESNRRVLERNLAGTPSRILAAAVAGTTGTARLALGVSVRHRLARDDEGPSANMREVPTLTIDDLLAHEPDRSIDVLKVDIEGAEVQAFAQPARTLDRVRTVIMEIHEPESVGPIERVLEAAGLRHDPRPNGTGQLDVPDVFRRHVEPAQPRKGSGPAPDEA